MMNSDPSIAIDEVCDLQSLLIFMEILSRDWDLAVAENIKVKSNPYESMHGWENINIGTFLEAGKAWAEDSKIISGDENVYKVFAHILLAGKHYE